MSNLASDAGETHNKPDSGPSQTVPPISSGADVTPGQEKNVNSEVHAKLQVIFDGVETGIFLIDPETHQILDANPLSLKLIGAERRQVLGAVCHKFVCPAERGRCPFTDLNQKVDNSERVLLTASGSRIPIIKTVRQVTISGRKLLLESFFDISERQRTVEALRESEDRYRDLVENSFVLISTHDSQGRFLSLNRATARVLEAANAEEVIGRSLADYIPSKLEPQFEKYLATILGEGHAEGRMVIAAPSGKVKVVEYRNTLRTHGLNEPVVRCVGHDVTDRIEAEKAQAFLASCMESSQDAIIGVDLKGNIISWNRGAHDLYGYSSGEALGKCISILAPPERLAELSRLMENARRGNGVSNLETERVGKDGQRHDVSLAITSVCNKEGILTGSVSIGRDITKRKRDEAILTERHRLAALVAEVGSALSTAESLRDGLQRCAEIMVRNIDAAFARVWTLKDNDCVLEMQASAGIYTHLDGAHSRVRVGKFKIGLIAQSGEAHLTNLVQDDPMMGDPEWARREGMVSFAGYPLKIEDQILGVVAAFARQPLTEDTLQAFASVADNMAQFIRRKWAEEALRESEGRYRLLFEHNLAGVFRGRFRSRTLLDCNDAYARILGFNSRHEALSQGKLQDFCDPLEAENAKSRLLKERVLANLEARFWRRDRTPVWVLANVSLAMAGEAEDPLIEGTIFDISERKRAEQALATERDLLGALMDNHPDFIYFKDRQSRFVRANQALAKSFGVPNPAAMAGKTDFDFFTVEHAQQAYDDEQEVISTGIAIVAKEEKETRPDGHATWVSTTKLPLRDAAGNIAGTFGVSRDITERKRTEDQTRLQTAALESAANGIAITDLEGRAIWVNPAFTSLTGYSTAEIIGQTMRLLKSGEHAPDFYETMWNTILSGQVWQGQIVNRRKDGTLYTDFTTITPVPDSEERFTHFVAVKQDATGRHRAQQALEERTAYLNTLVEISPYGVVVVNTDGLIQMSNSAFERLFRYSREEMLGASLDELIVPADLASEAKFLTGLCLNGLGACLTTCRRRKDGALVDVDINGVPIVIKGELRGVLALYQDISERKRAEADLVRYAEDLEVSKSVQEEHAQKLARLVEELAQERDLLGTLMDNIPDAIYYKDREGKLLRGNLALAKALGLKDPREAVGKSDFDFYPEEDAREYARNELQVIESGQAHSGQMTKVRQPDGEYRWRLTSNAPIRDTQGRVTGLVGIARDMTDRLQAEETLRVSEERYRELFENASDIVYTTGLDTHLTSLNRVGQQVLGYSAAEAMQLDLRDLVAPKHWNLVQRGRERIQAGERDVTLEVEVKSKDGRTMMLEVKPRLIVRGGKPAGIQGIGRNITGRDEAEMELRHAQKLESVGRLASGIAYEINTPIQFVGDNTRFLQDSFGCFQTLLVHYQKLREAAELGIVTPELVEKLRAIEEETDSAYLLDEIPKALAQTLEGVSRVATIVRAMKEFAHPEGKEMAAADLNKAILSTLTVARNEVKYVADVETEFGNLPLVVCNIGDLNQVFLNLLVNAAHAIGEVVNGSGKKGKIRVTTLAEGSTVLLTISDTGCGIPEANRAKVFDPFFTTKEVGRGTGQGLAIARSVVVDRHKGSLTFDTEIGKGTTFYIRLPVDPGQTPREANAV